MPATPEDTFDAFTDYISLWCRPGALFQLTPRGDGSLAFDGQTRLSTTLPNGKVFEIGRVTTWEHGASFRPSKAISPMSGAPVSRHWLCGSHLDEARRAGNREVHRLRDKTDLVDLVVNGLGLHKVCPASYLDHWPERRRKKTPGTARTCFPHTDRLVPVVMDDYARIAGTVQVPEHVTR